MRHPTSNLDGHPTHQWWMILTLGRNDLVLIPPPLYNLEGSCSGREWPQLETQTGPAGDTAGGCQFSALCICTAITFSKGDPTGTPPWLPQGVRIKA